MTRPSDARGVAIIGMACRFPGAGDPTAFWDNLCRGVESVTFFSDDELLAAGVAPALLRDPNYVKAAPILPDVDKFDAAFFGYSPREAAVLDPQHRLFLEVAWETFEDAGYHPGSSDGAIGVFAGGGGVVTSYLVAHRGHRTFPGETAGLQHLGNDKDFLSTRVSYKLNLTGPSVTVQTACSTSLVAVHLACQSLRHGECDMVLAGAATVRIPQVSGYLVEKGNVYSMDGHCRAFDAAGQGTIFGSGVAAVLLKNLEDALADGDHIYAVIKGTAVNNDGGMKVSYTAPSVAGQAQAMLDALTVAGVPPETIGYVECHATGTAVGDPLEIQALTRAFRTETARRRFCGVGSVKTNIGHPEQTAGLAGLIKTALALRHGRIPPSLHFVTPNPKIDFDQGPFYVNTTLSDWPTNGHPRRAAVNSLGIGGTNAFAVLEQAPPTPDPQPNPRPFHLFTLSAKTEAALLAYAERCRTFLQARPHAALADLCYTTNRSRSHFRYRFAATTDCIADLTTRLAAFTAGRAGTARARPDAEKRRLVFLFTGQGSQYPGMAQELYHTHPTFRRLLDECDAGLRSSLDKPLLDVLFARGHDGALVHETVYTQPALFAVAYALAQLWRAWGVVPGAVMGHSIGELVAACVAGVFDLGDALRLVAERGRLMQGLPKDGAMAVVFAAEAAVRDVLGLAAGRASIAAVNGPLNTVISGERGAVAEVLAALQRRDIAAKALTVSHAFHSPLMDPILDPLEAAARTVGHGEPGITLISNLTGKPADGAPAPAYWRDHARQTVRFADGMRTLRELGYDLFLEVGPGNALVGMGRQCLPGAGTIWLSSLTRSKRDWQAMLESLEVLYREGAAIDWPRVHEGIRPRRTPLPTYPFQRKRYWLDGPGGDEADERASRPGAAHPLLGVRNGLGAEGSQFEASYGLEQLPYLRDHRVHGRMVLPTAAGLEAALAAGRAHFGGAAVRLEDLTYHQALMLPDHGARPVRLVLRRNGDTRATFQLRGRDGDAEWRTHMSGVLSRADGSTPAAEEAGARLTVEAARARCPREIPGADYYGAVRELGLEYGPAFRGIQKLWRGEAEALSQVRLPAAVASASYGIHPAFLDACLHVYPALIDEVEKLALPPARRDDTYLPIGVERFCVYRDQVTAGWARAAARPQPAGSQTLVVDIRVFDEDSTLVARLDGLSLRRLPREALGGGPATPGDWLYSLRWNERPPAPRAQSARAKLGSWLIFADRSGVGVALAKALEDRGDWCHLVFPREAETPADPESSTVDPARPEDFRRLIREISAAEGLPCRGVVYLWGLDATSLADMTPDRLELAEALGAGGALFLTQALAEARSASAFTPRLWFVTRNAQSVAPGPVVEPAQAPLWGLGRTVALEYPALWGGLIDLPPASRTAAREAAEALAAELLQGDREGEVALRDGKRFVARLAHLPREGAGAQPARFHDDATYLITGGLGMLGLTVARWLAERQGARSLVLVGRRPVEGPARDVVEALRGRGVALHVVQADVSVEADVRRVMNEIRRGGLPLKGVFHCAGVLDDGVLAQMDWGQFTRVTAPKIRGSWLLHHHTRDVRLEFFVLHSSLLSLTGSAGQANYTAANAFLDALAAHRRGLGLPAMVVNWGPLADAGMTAATGSRGAAIWRARGTRFIPPEDGMSVLEHLMHRGVDQAAVAITDWTTYLQQFSEPPPLYAELTREVGAGRAPRHSEGDGELQARLREAPAGAQRSLLFAAIREQVMDELGFDDDIDPGQRLNELGLDSLMSVNVANRLERVLGIAVPLAKLIRGPSLHELTDELLPHLAGAAEVAEAAEDRVVATQIVRPEAPTGISPAGVSASSRDGWLVLPRPNPSAKVRLFCFHYAGGGAATFRPWADTLDPAIELVAIEPPGRGGRADEPPVETLDAFVEQLIPAIAPYLDKPFALFGHCLGALTLFETARHLLARHPLPLEHVFVSGARPPHLVAREGPFEREMLAHLLQHPEFDPFRPGHDQPDDVFADMLRRFNIGATDEFLRNPELRRLLLPLVRADFAMAACHRFTPAPPWEAPVTCFVGLGDPYVSREDALEWGRYTRVAFRLWMRETAHFLIVDDRAFILDTINRELGR